MELQSEAPPHIFVYTGNIPLLFTYFVPNAKMNTRRLGIMTEVCIYGAQIQCDRLL